MAILDSGNRREFGTGAVRDIAEGKGRCDLLPLIEVSNVTGDRVLHDIGEFMETGYVCYIYDAIRRFVDASFPDFPTAVLEYSIHMEEGCGKYGDRNWEKGIPAHSFADSAFRHFVKYMDGWTDEDHLIAAIWNLCGLAWTEEKHPELMDIPSRMECD